MDGRDQLFMLVLLLLVLVFLLGLVVKLCNIIPFPPSWVERYRQFAVTVEYVVARCLFKIY
ncbi:hypothetical protein RchiOBHm_Chr4g0431741 [Rosa chinensis]|uniref:Uncharacterized protein n=1 Tax=Rosa chinensis TaxID=74649 RepID=A0A2P6R0V7_ROSCH|nr:hypothetical protein RchiOBHm_Chr4g0431741 [Rosa chinensis]